MKISKINLVNFRNYSNVIVSLNKKMNIFDLKELSEKEEIVKILSENENVKIENEVIENLKI